MIWVVRNMKLSRKRSLALLMYLFRADVGRGSDSFEHVHDPYEMALMFYRKLEFSMNNPELGSDLEWLPYLAKNDPCYRAWRRSIGYGRAYRAQSLDDLLDLLISSQCISWGAKFAFWSKRLQLDCVT